MFRIILIIIALICTRTGFSQELIQEELLALEQKIFQATDDSIKQKILIQKFDFLIKNNILDSYTFNHVKRIIPNYLDTNERKRFYWNSALISHLNNEVYYSVGFLTKLSKLETSFDKSYDLLSFLVYQKYDTIKSSEIKKNLIEFDTIFLGLDCFNLTENYVLKNKKLILNASIFIPGIGSVLNGNVSKGLLSLGLNISSAYAITYLIRQNLYLNAIFWGSNLAGKFYLGNIRMTDKLVNQKEARQKKKLASECELKLDGIFKKYPFSFK